VPAVNAKVDLLGKRFGRLLVVGSAPRDKTKVATKARWSCVCDCGKSIITRTDYLRLGRSTSCGCWLNGERLPDSRGVWHQVYHKIRSNARDRRISFSLTREQVLVICARHCHYCGVEPMQPRTANGRTVLYNGIDRLDSAQGYVIDNVVACCRWCNCAKNVMSVDDFRSWLSRAYQHFVKAGETC
jgi:hypothetical protein